MNIRRSQLILTSWKQASISIRHRSRSDPHPSAQFSRSGEPRVRRHRQRVKRHPNGLSDHTNRGEHRTWIVPEIYRRLTLIGGWDVFPDFASVNFHEPGAVEMCKLLLDKGIGVEAGIWNVEAAHRFRQSGLSTDCLRVLIEPGQEPGVPRSRLEEIEAALHDTYRATSLHGFETSAWELVALASRRGYDARIGFEDTLSLPDGSRAEDNGQLAAAAQQITASTCLILSAVIASAQKQTLSI